MNIDVVYKMMDYLYNSTVPRQKKSILSNCPGNIPSLYTGDLDLLLFNKFVHKDNGLYTITHRGFKLYVHLKNYVRSKEIINSLLEVNQ